MDIITTSNLQGAYNVVFMKLHQHGYEESEMRTIYGSMVIFPQRCFKVVNNTNNNITYASYLVSIL